MNKHVASLILAAVAAPAWTAESASAGLDRLVACADVRDARDRLSCFDREVAPMARARAAAAVPRAPAAPPAVVVAKPTFGEEQLAPKQRSDDAAAEETLHAQISSLRAAGTSTFFVTLDNGQSWRHEDQHLGSYLRVGDAITISKGAMGSYRLTRDAGQSRNWIRVTRVR